MPINKLIAFLFFVLIQQQAHAIASEDLLPPEQVFKLSAQASAHDHITASWTIADGYYLYRTKIKIESQSDMIDLGTLDLPPGELKHDETFGDTVIYRNALNVGIPLITKVSEPKTVTLKFHYQGCADIGICYPPQQSTLTIDLPPVPGADTNPVDKLITGLKGIGLNLFEDELLPPDQAFRFFADIETPSTMHVRWQLADGYYLYREKIQLEVISSEWAELGAFNIPQGNPKYDETFGQVEVFHNELDFHVPLIRKQAEATKIVLKAKFQGCADRGVCYPPMEKTVELMLPPADLALITTAQAAAPLISEQEGIVNSLHQDTLWMTLLSFFGFGLLLSFTPCVFPMIPILSGIIVRHSNNINTRRAFLLSLSYVLASAATYTIFGILAALFGSNLQASFQQPWIIVLFSGIFILLSLSMFGFYNLELPKSIQAKLHNSSEKHRGNSYVGTAIMGVLSSLIVGPCVAAPLAGALIYIGQTGDAVLGGLALFMMGFGMGTPLLLLGASAGKLLPKAGQWLNSTKSVFGVIMLAVAVWMLSRILSPAVTMFLWAMLLIIPAIYLKAIDPLPESASGWLKLWKGTGIIMLSYGILLLIGLSMGNSNPLQPLQGFRNNSAVAAEHNIVFTRVTSAQELADKIHQAQAENKRVMLDFYADWCISCKEMETYTLADESVQKHLSQFVLLQADVTENSPQDQALLKQFNLVGPPAILFFDLKGNEKQNLRVIGYQNVESFTKTLQQVTL